ncbi:DUF503 domain-containing protein [Lachnospiraceae bacterium NSJ-143]|nr:DUF503 domain-containing protein [Lachnospiraceae bacterium NSJ-143]
MIIGTCIVYLEAPWVESLKEKRMVVKSIIDKSKHKFNISIAEVENQDMHKSIAVGFACVTNEVSHANSIIDNVINFIGKNTDADILDTVIEIL